MPVTRSSIANEAHNLTDLRHGSPDCLVIHLRIACSVGARTRAWRRFQEPMVSSVFATSSACSPSAQQALGGEVHEQAAGQAEGHFAPRGEAQATADRAPEHDPTLSTTAKTALRGRRREGTGPVGSADQCIVSRRRSGSASRVDDRSKQEQSRLRMRSSACSTSFIFLVFRCAIDVQTRLGTPNGSFGSGACLMSRPSSSLLRFRDEVAKRS